MKKITLERLIYKNYLKTSLASIFLIGLVLTIIYFSVNNNMIKKNINFILKEIKNNTYQLINEKTMLIEKKISEIESLTKALQTQHENFFKNPQKYNLMKKPKFDFAKNGTYYKVDNNGGSSVFVSKDTKIDDALKNELIETEIFDLTFKTLVDHDKDIVAIYYNSSKNYNRYFPFLEDVYNVFPPDMKMKNYNFYYLANEKYNKERKVVFTDVYLDPAKQGWLISAIVPIYNENKLEGVTGIDITVDDFINSFLDNNLPYDGKSFIMDNSGKIIAMPKEIKEIFNIRDISKYEYKLNEKIKHTIYRSDEFSIFNYPDRKVVNTFENIIENKSYNHDIKIDDKEYLLFTNKMKNTSWRIISLIDKDKVLKEVHELELYYKKLGLLIIVTIILFYVGFFFFLQYKARKFVKLINVPLLKIIDITKNLGTNKNIKSLESCGIFEIDKVNNNFNTLVNELDYRTNKLIEEETKRAYQEKLANTDPLTGSFNRRYLNEFSIEYLRIIKRENKNLSLLMVDIDDFKNINDTFGHETGDKVIKQLVSIIKDVVRENDLIVRFGGDEFLILLPNTNLINARLVGQKIADHIDKYNKDKEFNFTISMGVSMFNKQDNSIEDMISRADNALYEAKKIGKNCIV
jgi:diguanylate cyclase (GGDEF)-like protein